jgi:hypothetical protein
MRAQFGNLLGLIQSLGVCWLLVPMTERYGEYCIPTVFSLCVCLGDYLEGNEWYLG